MSHPNAMSMDEIEQAEAATQGQGPNLDETKLDGESVPEELRGKSIADVLRALDGTKKALLTSEQARQEAQRSADAAARPPQGAPKPEEETEKELTDEELAELHKDDPIKAISAASERAAKRIAREYEARLAPMLGGNAATVEANMRQKYPDEFALFEQEIKDLTKQVRNPAALSNPGTWDDIVSYVRGREGNFDRLVTRRTEKSSETARVEAQRAQAANAGASVMPAMRTPPAAGADKITDPVEKAIADEMIDCGAFKDYNDYLRWKQMGA